MWMKKLLILAGLVFLLVFGCASKEPTSLTAKQVKGGVQLDWAPVQDVAGYNVYRGTDGTNFDKLTVTPLVGETTFTDRAVNDSKTYYYMVKSVDSGGTEYGKIVAQVTAKTAPPAISMTINNEAEFTVTPQVDLQLKGDGMCRFSNDGLMWSDWEGFSISRSWTFTGSDGEKTVYYQCKDDLGNLALPISASIYLDTIPPDINMASPVDGKTYVGSFDLIFTATDEIAEQLTCNGKLGGEVISIGVVESGKENKVTIHTTTGSKTLTLDCTSDALKSSKSVAITITDQPTVALSLGDGSGYTTSTTVKATLVATNAKECRLSNDNAIWGSWTAYTTDQNWRLISGDGLKTVYAQCRSGSDAVSDTVTDTITLDTTPPPYISITINNERSWTNSQNVVLGLYAFGAAQCRFQNDIRGWGTWETYATSRSWTLSSGEGNKSVSFDCKNMLGDELGPVSASIYYSEVKPEPPSNLDISVNNGDSYTTSRDVYLKLYADNADECRYRQDDYSWTGWYAYTTSRSMTLQGDDGTKTIYYQCRNDFGSKTGSDSIYLQTAPPQNIDDLNARSSASAISLFWTKPVGKIKSYQVYRSNTEMGLFTKIASISSSYYVDFSAEPGVKYAYTVRSTDVIGQQSGDSNLVNGEILPPSN
jgi:hypothetical protein